MKLEKWAPILIVVIVVAGALLIARGLGLFNRTAPVDTSQVEMQRVITMDKENLAKEGADENSISTALERLSIRTDADVKDYIKKYAGHPSPQVQAAAAESAGSFLNEPGFLPIVQEALKSSNEQVRLGGLRGLARQGGEENEKLLLAYMKKAGLTTDENFQANMTLVKIATTPERKRESIQRLVALSEKTGASEKLADVFLYAPNEKILIEKAKGIFEKSQSPDLNARALQYLTAYDKPWMQEHILQAPVLNNLRYQIVLLDSLRATCPPDRDALLKKIKAAPAAPEVTSAAEAFSCK